MQKQAERKEPINASSTTRNGLESGEREIIVVTRCSTITQWGKLPLLDRKRKKIQCLNRVRTQNFLDNTLKVMGSNPIELKIFQKFTNWDLNP